MADAIDYRAVLADLKAKRVAIDQAIAVIEPLAGELSTAPNPSSGSTGTSVQADSFVGLNITEAAAKYLRMAGRPAKTTEQVSEALRRGGMNVTQASVSSILRKNNRDSEGDVIKVGRGLWGLQEWYPGRPRRTRQGNEEEK